MYPLTPKMQQTLQQSLEKYHNLFDSGRCSGWEFEELIYKSIQSDKTVGYRATWREEGPHDRTNIRVRINGEIYPLQIQACDIKKTTSGDQRKPHLVVSGERLARFRGNLEAITKHLNKERGDLLGVHYRQVDDHTGKYHIYQLLHVEAKYYRQLNSDQWKKVKSNWTQINPYGVIHTVYLNVNWEIWWRIPLSLVHPSPEFRIPYRKLA